MKLMSKSLFQQQNHGTILRNIVRLEELPLPKSKYVDKWIQHIKVVGNHSISVIHVHPHQ